MAKTGKRKRRNRGKRMHKNGKSPLKDWKTKSPTFGKVQYFGDASLRNIGNRSTVRFLRNKNPDWTQKEMIKYCKGFIGKTVIEKYWNFFLFNMGLPVVTTR